MGDQHSHTNVARAFVEESFLRGCRCGGARTNPIPKTSGELASKPPCTVSLHPRRGPWKAWGLAGETDRMPGVLNPRGPTLEIEPSDPATSS
ncbi:hypothetical protein GDO81_026855 [Engystomops pustulosus]|uniref:Uncharacterized protein n=1 Tax=Engystomops pustulosus TaxID=76066 RepID=A0AAV6YQC0_ENGPU|nr:hypothetical protein GDO81_026855 [Engystomops pustulosus]